MRDCVCGGPGRWRLLPLEEALAALGDGERAAMAERERRFRREVERLSLTDPAAWRRFLRDGVFLAPFGEHSELPQFGRACVERGSGRLAGWISGELDGGEKYVNPAMTHGRDVLQVMRDERLRESGMTLAVDRVMRFTFSDVANEARLVALLERFGIPHVA